MNWNIERISDRKLAKAGMLDAITRTVVDQDIDILVLVELCGNTALAMNNLSNALNIRAGAVAGGAVNDYNHWYISKRTGNEYYGFIIKDSNLIRPLGFNVPAYVPPQPGYNPGTEEDPLTSLDVTRWTTWPDTFGNLANAYAPPAGIAAKPEMPLIDLYARMVSDPNRDARFYGQPNRRNNQAARGNAEGNGARLPCLALFMVHGAADYLLPIIPCHYGASMEDVNPQALGQIGQLKALHISQLFDDTLPAPGPNSHNITADGNPKQIREILFTGDYNVNFLDNDPARRTNSIKKRNSNALINITPTMEHGGSALPNVVLRPVNAGQIAKRQISNIGGQALKAAVTDQKTHLIAINWNTNPATLADTRSKAFDNFFYGGTQLNQAVLNPGPVAAIDAGKVIDIPENVYTQHDPPAVVQDHHIDVEQLADTYYVNMINLFNRDPSKRTVIRLKKTNCARILAGRGAGPHNMSFLDRLFGARLVSDHLPVILEFPV